MTIPANAAQIQGQGAVSADNLNTMVQLCTTAAQLRSIIGLPNMTVYLLGTNGVDDGTAGSFYWNASSAAPDDGLNTIVPNGSAQGAWIRVNQYTSSGAITQQLTTKFFAQDGAVVDRLNDRIFMGGATANDGAYPNATKDWLSSIQVGWGLSGGSIVSSQAAILTSLTSAASVALTVGSQSQYSTGAGQSTIALEAFAINNNSTLGTNAWAAYFQANRYNSVNGSVYGLELDVSSFATTINPNPNQQGNAVGLQIASGGQYPVAGQVNTSCAIQIANNPSLFQCGINILPGSIVTNNPSLNLPPNNPIVFTNAGGHQIAAVNCTDTGSSSGVSVNFTANGLQIAGGDGSAIAYFNKLTNGANWLAFSGAATGSGPLVAAAGGDTDIDLQLQSKGAGLVKFVNSSNMSANGSVATALSSVGPTGSHTTVQEWLTIKNPAGVARYVPCF